MVQCACKDLIEELREIMELTYDEHKSFTNPHVLAASQELDDALVNYRKCPRFDYCNSPQKPIAHENLTPYITIKRIAV